MSIVAVFKPLDSALWHGKWASSALAVAVLGMVWPAAAGISVLRAVQASTGSFYQWGVLTLISAMMSVGGTVAGALLGGSATSTALGFSVGTLLGASLNAYIALETLGLRLADNVRAPTTIRLKVSTTTTSR